MAISASVSQIVESVNDDQKSRRSDPFSFLRLFGAGAVGAASRLAAVGPADAALKGVEGGAFRIGRRRLRLVEHVAKVEKLLLVGAAFGKVGFFHLATNRGAVPAAAPENEKRRPDSS